MGRAPEGEFYTCYMCNKRVEWDEAVKAHLLIDTPGEKVEGEGILFHPACYPGESPRWRRVD